MSHESSRSIELDQLVDSFVARLRNGERPSVSDYADRHPELSHDIRELFPLLAEMEGLRHDTDSHSGSSPGIGAAPEGVAIHPAQLGDYRIIRLIGRGGMGVVYEARRESLSAHVALKVLRQSFRADEGFLRRFRNEARAAARLHHTNIVPVFDFGEHDGILYYVMQYIPGQGLDRVMADVRRLRGGATDTSPAAADAPARSVAWGLLAGRFDSRETGLLSTKPSDPTAPAPVATTTADGAPDPSPLEGSSHVSGFVGGSGSRALARYHREVARVGAQVADALAHAHSLNVLHRDIKPSNLLLDARGNAWVTDFGLAKVEDGEGDLTAPGDVTGTLRYMPPERFSGESDRRGDIYALGVTLYEMVALMPAHGARGKAPLIREILHDEPAALRKLEPRVPRDLETIIHKAMAREVSARYQTAAAMAEDLHLFLTDRPPNARRASPQAHAWRWCRRNPLAATLAAAAAALLFAFVTVLALSRARLGEELVKVEAADRETLRHLDRALAADRESDEKLWEAKLVTARAYRYSGRSGRRFDALDVLAEAADLGRALGHRPEEFAKLRDEAIAALALSDTRIARTFGRWTDDVVTVDIDDSFELYATSYARGACVVRRVRDDSEVARLPETGGERRIGFGTGRWLADHDLAGTRRLTVWDLSGKAPVARVEVGPSVLSWGFRADGRLLAVAQADGSLAAYDLPSGERRGVPPRRPFTGVPCLRPHPTAAVVAVTGNECDALEVRDIATGETVAVGPPRPGTGCSPAAWGHDGRQLAVAWGGARTLAIYDFTERPRALVLSRDWELDVDNDARDSTLAFNREGDRLLGRGWGSNLHMVDANSGLNLFRTKSFMFPPANSEARVLRADEAGERLFPGVVSDGDSVRRFAYWSVAPGRECRLLVAPRPRQGNLLTSLRSGVTADGRLAMKTLGERVLLFDVATGRQVGDIVVRDAAEGLFARFDRSGRLITNSRGGCYRWPVRVDPSAPADCTIGPPERLDLDLGFTESESSRDGTVIAQGLWPPHSLRARAGGLILRPGAGDGPRVVASGVALANVSVSPDGQWVAFGGAPGPVLVFDATTGEQVWTWPGTSTNCQFSPDGKWLAVTSDDGRLYATGTWEPGPRLGPGYLGAFSADGSLLVLASSEGPSRLLDVASGRELARLEDPDWEAPYVHMSADGGTLVATHKAGLRVWDLRLIREGLDKLGLDWAAPPLPPRRKSSGPLVLKIVGADLIGPQPEPPLP